MSSDPDRPSSGEPPTLWLANSGPVSLMRLRLRNGADHNVPDPPLREGFGLIVQLQDFADHTLWRDGRVAHVGGHAKGTLSIADMARDIRCEHRSACDNLRFIVDRAALDEWAYQEGLGPTALSPQVGLPDPVLFSLAQAVAPCLSPRREPPLRQLFIDQIVQACLTHIALVHGGAAPRPPLKLSPHEVGLAKAYLADLAPPRQGLATIAAACDLPRAGFVAAFKATVGITPRQWALNHQLDRASRLFLRGEEAEAVAQACGFRSARALLRSLARRSGLAMSPSNRVRNLH